LPFLFAGALGVATSAVAGGAINLATAMLIGWALGGALGGALGIAALWVAVLSDGGANLGQPSRLVLAIGLVLGMAVAARWLWVMGTNGHRYEATTWAVWVLLLGGPVVVACLRLTQLWSSARDGSA
jgi:hypothetical protein